MAVMSPRAVKRMICIGQVWQHKKNGDVFVIQQVHRMDGQASGTLTSDGKPHRTTLYFNDLGKGWRKL